MRPLLSRALALIALLQLLGGHWVVLQTAAWVGMTLDFSKQSSLASAISKTLDGQHPCKMCETVKQGQSKDQKIEFSKNLLKTEAVLAKTFFVPVPPLSDARPLSGFCIWSIRRDPPPTQPPLLG